MKVLRETARFSNGERISTSPSPRILLEDPESLEICDEGGNLVVTIDIGVKTQKPERHITVNLPETKEINHLWLTSGGNIMIVPKRKGEGDEV